MVAESISDSTMPTIPQFFHGKSVFVTGGTGFMGKVLLSKLLRSLDGIDKIYVLIRSNRGKSAATRLKEMLTLPLFDSVPPSNHSKLVLVEGDILKLRLGLSESDYKTIVQNVSVVFHVAATVRFNESLTTAILINVRATREVVNMCLEMKQLTALLHVSTTYCNCDLKTVEEQVYPSSMDWRDAIKMVESLDPAVINTFSDKFIGNKPNTYTFTKSLGEQIVWDHRHLLPTVIFRPSIVVSTWKDPVSGWLDNFNGPVGCMLGTGHGIIRVAIMGLDIVPDYMPVDVAIRAVIVATYIKGVKGLQVSPDELVLNCSSRSTSISNKELMDIGYQILDELPLTNALWLPSNDTTTSTMYFTVKSWFAHLLPAVFIDFVLRMLGKEPRLVDIQRRIYVAFLAISYFSCRQWEFKNEKFLGLLQNILPEDKEEFYFDFRDIDAYLYLKNSVIGARKYLINDPIENVPEGKKWKRWLYWIHKVTMSCFLLLVVFLLGLPDRLQFLWQSTTLNSYQSLNN